MGVLNVVLDKVGIIFTRRDRPDLGRLANDVHFGNAARSRLFRAGNRHHVAEWFGC